MRAILIGALSLSVCSAVSAEADRDVGVSSRMHAQATLTRITVTGEVRTPGPLVIDGPMTLLAAIARAGGYTADAAVIEIHRRSSGTGLVTVATPADEYQTQYVSRIDPASKASNDPFLVDGDFLVVRPVLELHPPMPAGQFGAGSYRLDWVTWGVTAPAIRTSSEPRYTRAGMALKLQGVVEVEVAVKADGTVGDARVIRGLDARLPDLVAELERIGDAHAASVLQIVGNGPIGLDANALECVKTWTFVPGTILGRPVSVIRTVSVPFKLR